MEFIAFPLRVGSRGQLIRSATPEESLVRLLEIMFRTPQQGWRGSAQFGIRDALAGIGFRQGSRLATINQMNQALEEIGIDWARVEAIEREQASDPFAPSYVVTLSVRGGGVEVCQIQL